ncbi:hypothetical protein [Marinobacter nauticus]|uniref:hypothetical protein n=1 Tax=Marinobacter nauticus TaxID=2743 RepID=UPI004044CF0A
MANFKTSFRKGIESAKAARENRSEIEKTLQDLNDELDELTNGKIEIIIHEFSEPIEQDYASILISGFSKPKYIEYQGLAARNKTGSASVRELATWSQGREGYPCKIKFGNKTFICEDKEGLIEALQELLEDAKVGEIFEEIMNS